MKRFPQHAIILGAQFFCDNLVVSFSFVLSFRGQRPDWPYSVGNGNTAFTIKICRFESSNQVELELNTTWKKLCQQFASSHNAPPLFPFDATVPIKPRFSPTSTSTTSVSGSSLDFALPQVANQISPGRFKFYVRSLPSSHVLVCVRFSRKYAHVAICDAAWTSRV